MGYNGNRGKGLERDILQAIAYYTNGRAAITQMPTPVRISKVIGQQVTGYMEKSTVDFHGTIKGGRAVYFDAKECKSGRFELLNPKVLKPHQLEYLKRQNELGALAFILLDFTAEKEAYTVPYPVLAEYYQSAFYKPKGSKGKSLKLDDCRKDRRIYRVDTSKGYLDFLAPFLI